MHNTRYNIPSILTVEHLENSSIPTATHLPIEILQLVGLLTIIFEAYTWCTLGTIPDRNHTVLDRQGSAAHEIFKIIESPLP